MFNKLRKSAQFLPTPTAESAQPEDIPYWARLKSIYSSSLAKNDTKKAQRRQRRQAKRANGAVDKPQPPHARARRYPVEIIGKLPPDGIPRPPSFIYTAPIKHFQAPHLRMPSYADDRYRASPPEFFPEHASVRHSLFSNAGDPFSVRPSQFLLPENAPFQFFSHNSHDPNSRCCQSSAAHVQPILEDASPIQTLHTNLHPFRESGYFTDSASASVYSQEGVPCYPTPVQSCRNCTSYFPGNLSSSGLPLITLAPVPEHARYLRRGNHPPPNVPASHYSREGMSAHRFPSHTAPTRTVSAHSDETLVDRSRRSDASFYPRTGVIPVRSSAPSRVSRLSISTVGTVRPGTNGQNIDVWQSYGKEIDDSDSDSNSTYDDSDSESISSVSSVSSAETAFYSCDDMGEDKTEVVDTGKNVFHKARMDVLAVAEALKDAQDERTSMGVKFREDIVTSLAHVFTEVAAHDKAKQRHLAPSKWRSGYSLTSLDDTNKMPGAYVIISGARGCSASTANLL